VINHQKITLPSTTLIPHTNNEKLKLIKMMPGFLVDKIFVIVGDQVFKQSVGIIMVTGCAPLLVGLFMLMKGKLDVDCLRKAGIDHMRHFSGIIRHLQCTIGFKSLHFDKNKL
jgi:hypothetical protein